MTYKIITWPEIQDYMSHPDFQKEAVLINTEDGIKRYGYSAYFVPEYIINEVEERLEKEEETL